MRRTAGLIAAVLLLTSSPLAAQPEIVAAIQVHGNTITPADEIIRVSDISIGVPVSDALLSDAEARLSTALKFESVEVLKRFASISDPTRVLILIQVDEGPVRVDLPEVDTTPEESPAPPAPRPVVVRRSKFGVMFVPILSAEDGYGFTYGAQLAFAGHRSARRRIVVPASWGGDKRVGADISRSFRSVSLRGCAREGSFRDARIRSSMTTPTGNARGGEPSGRSSGRFVQAGKSRGRHRRSTAKKYQQRQSALMSSSTRESIR